MSKTILDVARHTAAYQKSLEEERQKRIAFFKRLRSAKVKFDASRGKSNSSIWSVDTCGSRARVIEFDSDSSLHPFAVWVRNSYGIHLTLDDAGNITPVFSVVDEHKYLLFCMSF